jgi:hypothetical protein
MHTYRVRKHGSKSSPFHFGAPSGTRHHSLVGRAWSGMTRRNCCSILGRSDLGRCGAGRVQLQSAFLEDPRARVEQRRESEPCSSDSDLAKRPPGATALDSLRQSQTPADGEDGPDSTRADGHTRCAVSRHVTRQLIIFRWGALTDSSVASVDQTHPS